MQGGSRTICLPRACFLRWICTIQTLHNISQRHARIYFEVDSLDCDLSVRHVEYYQHDIVVQRPEMRWGKKKEKIRLMFECVCMPAGTGFDVSYLSLIHI